MGRKRQNGYSVDLSSLHLLPLKKEAHKEKIKKWKQDNVRRNRAYRERIKKKAELFDEYDFGQLVPPSHLDEEKS